jgi:spoIIIJ-associated protein
MDITKTIQEETAHIVHRIVPDAEVEVSEEEELYFISIKTEEDAPTLIGRHGDTIKALQKILEVILYKQLQQSVRLIVNVNDYREKQQERLEHIAKEHAERAIEHQGASYLRGFSSFERKIMHEFITTQYPDLTSYSVGEGRDRRLVVDVKHEKTDFTEMQEE